MPIIETILLLALVGVVLYVCPDASTVQAIRSGRGDHPDSAVGAAATRRCDLRGDVRAARRLDGCEDGRMTLRELADQIIIRLGASTDETWRDYAQRPLMAMAQGIIEADEAGRAAAIQGRVEELVLKEKS